MISLNGQIANTWLSTPNEIFLSRAMAPTRVVYTIPEGVDAELPLTDNGFGHGYDGRFVTSKSMDVNADGSSPVKVAVFVPSSKRLPVIVEWEPVGGPVTASDISTTNRWSRRLTARFVSASRRRTAS